MLAPALVSGRCFPRPALALRGRNLFIPVLALVACCLLLSGVTAVRVEPPGVAAPGGSEGLTALASLPIPVQGAISETLGRSDPAYSVDTESGLLSADNPRHELGAEFSQDGVRLFADDAELTMRLTAVGRGNPAGAPAPSAISARANRVVYTHPGLIEWYVNGPLGIQQGFTMTDRPAGTRPLKLEVGFTGPVEIRLEEAGQGATLKDPSTGLTLEYTGLTAFDASGRTLDAHLSSVPGGLAITVDDRGARYPLTIDPFVQRAELTASNGAADDEFAISISISGDTVVAGAPHIAGDTGVAYVFEKPAGGWADGVETAILSPSDPAEDVHFGEGVAIDGDTVVVGAPFAEVGGEEAQGAVYIFERPPGGWVSGTQTAKLVASDPNDEDEKWLGFSVAIDGDTVVAGAPDDGAVDHDRGSVYVFVRPGAGWVDGTQTAKLLAADGLEEDQMGGSVAIDGSTVVAGQISEDGSRSAAYVFDEPVGGWTDGVSVARLTGSDIGNFHAFGASVTVSGDTVAAGAPVTNSAAGAVYVFVRPGGGWTSATQTARLTASDGQPGDGLGFSVALSGQTLVAGSHFDDNGEGAAYVYEEPPGGWVNGTQTQKLMVAGGAPRDDIGHSVAVDGESIALGAPAIDNNSDPGAAYIFELITLGTLRIEKTTSGGTGTFTFDVDCDGTDFDRSGLQIDTNGFLTVESIPTGTTCTVTEAPHDDFNSSSLPADGQVTIAEGTPESNTVAFTNTLKSAGMSVSKTCNPDPVAPGGTVACTLTVTNSGPDDAQNVVVTDTLPDGLTLVGGSGLPSGAGFTCDSVAGGASFTCTRTSQDPGQAEIVFTARLDETAGPNQTFSNVVSVSNDRFDPDASDNTATTEIHTPACTIGPFGGGGGVSITGTPGDDVICGSAGSDNINGGGGDDVIFGLGGHDKIDGGGGNDTIYGGSGLDSLSGGGANDVIFGFGGADTLEGGAGDDELYGGVGQDRLEGGPGTDLGEGGPGADRCTSIESGVC